LRTSALVRLSTLVSVTAIGLSVASPATADGAALPVVVADTVSLYPGQVTQVNVLANDSSPTGDTLDVCRFPETDFDDLTGVDAVAVPVPALFDGKAGDLMVGLVHGGTHVIDYFVCDHTHLVPAQLTLTGRPVAPVNVRKVPGKPGRLSVQNTNDAPVTFVYSDPRRTRPLGRVRIAAGDTRTVTVSRPVVRWVAEIGSSTGELSSPGIADQGTVRGIRPGR
jgi:hypothetical protein